MSETPRFFPHKRAKKRAPQFGLGENGSFFSSVVLDTPKISYIWRSAYETEYYVCCSTDHVALGGTCYIQKVLKHIACKSC